DIYLPGDFEESATDAETQVGLTVRIDFFGDQIESIKTFDLDTLGSARTLQGIRLMDLKGQLPDTGSSTHLFCSLPPETIVVLWAPLEIAEQAKSYLDRLTEQKGIYPLSALLKHASGFNRLELIPIGQTSGSTPSFGGGEQVTHFDLPIRSLQKFETEAKKAIKELAEMAN